MNSVDMRSTFLLVALAVPFSVLVTGCPAAETSPSTGPEKGADGSTPAPDAGETATDGGDAGGGPGACEGTGAKDTSAYTWKKIPSPCEGGNLLGLAPDGPSRFVAACGFGNTATEGIHLSTDGGATWAKQGMFQNHKPGRLRRASDCSIDIAGLGPENEKLFGIDATLPNNLKPVVLVGDKPGLGIAREVARSRDGKLIVANGDAVANAVVQMPGGEPVLHPNLHEDAIGGGATASEVRALRIVPVGNDFYAAGNKRVGNSDGPAEVYLPSKKTSPDYHFAALQLQPDNESGRLVDMHAWGPDSMVAAGYDNTFKTPLVYVCKGDPYVRANWRQVDPQLFERTIPQANSGIDAIAASGERVIVAGSYLTKGFVSETTDRGVTWKNITETVSPGGLNSVFDAGNLDEGRMYVATSTDVFVFGP